MTSTLTIRLPTGMKQELERMGRLESKTTGDLVRESLRGFLAVRKFRAVRRKILPFAEAQGLLTDEDVFQALS
jgi:hypothetical protein